MALWRHFPSAFRMMKDYILNYVTLDSWVLKARYDMTFYKIKTKSHHIGYSRKSWMVFLHPSQYFYYKRSKGLNDNLDYYCIMWPSIATSSHPLHPDPHQCCECDQVSSIVDTWFQKCSSKILQYVAPYDHTTQPPCGWLRLFLGSIFIHTEVWWF